MPSALNFSGASGTWSAGLTGAACDHLCWCFCCAATTKGDDDAVLEAEDHKGLSRLVCLGIRNLGLNMAVRWAVCGLVRFDLSLMLA